MNNTNLIRSLLVFTVTMVPQYVFAAENPTSISGSTQIKLNVKNVKNLIEKSSNSTSRIMVGSVRQSQIKGDLDINVDAQNVKNTISGATHSVAITRIGSVDNSSAQNISLNVRTKNVTTGVIRGTRNRAITNIGSVANYKTNGNINLDINVTQDVDNTIRGGRGSTSVYSLGSID